MPLHPALVHVPIGLALVLGAVLSALAWLSRSDTAPRAFWWVGAALAVVVAGSALAASSAGEDLAHEVRRRVPAAALEAHEEAADLFTWSAVAVAVLALVAGVAAKPKPRRALQLATAVFAFALIPLAVRAGHAGGELVWSRNATSLAPPNATR